MNLKQSLHRKPLHIQIAEVLRKQVIPKYKLGERIDPESKLAKRLGVSVVTLRQSLSVLEHQGMIERRHGSGTYVTDHRKQKTVAVATATDQGQSVNSFQMRLFLLLGELVKRHGYSCRSYVASVQIADGWSELIEDIQQRRIDGAAFVAMDAVSAAIPLMENGVPYLQTGGCHGSVMLDFAELMRTGVRHLAERGCRRIAVMHSLGAISGDREAHEALCSTLRAYGQPIREEWIRQSVPPETPGAGWEQFREIWSARDEKPDGLLVTDDVLFRDVAMAILDSRIQVPQQLQVVVHANKGSGLTYPFPVSLLEVDLNEWAGAMVDRLIKLMKQEPVSPTIQYIHARLNPNGEKPPVPVPTGTAAGLKVEITK